MIRVPISAVFLTIVLSGGAVAGQEVRHRAVRPSFPPSQSGIGVTLDQSRAASASISTQGGSLSATAADGTQFTLTVPAGAFLSDEDITITPVAGISRLPLSGGLLAAVQLQPDGLRLMQPATLVIQLPAQQVSSGGQRPIGFAYHGSGNEFHLFPSELSGPFFDLSLMHFSGYGVGSGTDGDVQAQQQRAPASAEDRAEQDIATGEERFVALQAWWATLVGQLQGASNNPAEFESVFFQFLTWRSLALAEPRAFPLIDAGWSYVNTALINAIQNAASACVADPSRVRVILRLVAIARQPELQMRSNALAIARSLVSKCLTFELQFDSEMSLNSTILRWDARLKSTVTFHMELDQTDKPIVIPASSPLTYVSYTTFYAGCISEQTQTTDSTLTIENDQAGTLSRIEFFLDLPDNSVAGSRPRDITITIDTGLPSDRVLSLTCGEPPYTQPVPSGPEYWRAGWAMFHGGLYGENERISETFTQIRNWDFLGGRLYAQKVYSRSSPTEPVVNTEMTTLKLFHRPVE